MSRVVHGAVPRTSRKLWQSPDAQTIWCLVSVLLHPCLEVGAYVSPRETTRGKSGESFWGLPSMKDSQDLRGSVYGFTKDLENDGNEDCAH